MSPYDWTHKQLLINREITKQVAKNQTMSLQLRRSQCVLTFSSNFMIDRFEERAKEILVNCFSKQTCKAKFIEYVQGISFIQKRIRKQLRIRYSKVDVLMIYWDKVIGTMIKEQSKFNDKRAEQLTVEFSRVPKAVRDACFKKYIDHCKAVYNIAFMQWRLIYPTTSEYANEEELKEIIMGRIQYQTKQTNLGQRVSKKTDELAVISNDFLIKYDFADSARLQPHTINSFAQIGLSDPFPDDD